MTRLIAVSAAAVVLTTPAFADAPASDTTTAPVVVSADRTSLTVPDTDQAKANLQRTAGGVELVPDSVFKNGAADTLKDVLAWVPGVFTSEARYGDDIRVSIRGSGLSRPYGNRGINMYMDGVPINTSDGLVDLFEIDPSAYRYVEVYKGANAMRYGANSLGGAVNLVTPTGYDASRFEGRVDGGSFGYVRGQASAAGSLGNLDGFFTVSGQRFDGYRVHSDGHQEHASANLGYRFSANIETRFYLNLNSIRDRMPGELDEATALGAPKTANVDFVWKDQQRNIDSGRLANKTTVRFGTSTLEFSVFGVYRHVDHPNYLYLDYSVSDYGGYLRFTDDRTIGDYRNTLVAGSYLQNGKINSKNYQYANTFPFGAYPDGAIPGTGPGAVKGALLAATLDEPKNVAAYIDDAFYLRPDLSINAGGQFQHVARPRENLLNESQSGNLTFNNASPKVGLLWDMNPASQLFANVSRSAEVPTYDVNANVSTSYALKAQTATTYEIGTRGRHGMASWDFSFYRAQIRDELQCVSTYPGSCVFVNADRTVHQGVEAGGSVELPHSVTLNVAYTYNDFHFENDPVYGNHELAGVPEHLVRAEAVYKHSTGFYAGPGVEWMPSTYFVDNANTTTVGKYALLSFKAGFGGFHGGWSGYVEGRNLTDKRYISTVDVAGTASPAAQIFYPGTGRSIRAGLQFDW